MRFCENYVKWQSSQQKSYNIPVCLWRLKNVEQAALPSTCSTEVEYTMIIDANQCLFGWFSTKTNKSVGSSWHSDAGAPPLGAAKATGGGLPKPLGEAGGERVCTWGRVGREMMENMVSSGAGSFPKAMKAILNNQSNVFCSWKKIKTHTDTHHMHR